MSLRSSLNLRKSISRHYSILSENHYDLRLMSTSKKIKLTSSSVKED
jgi:hypothetical protein